MKIQERHFTQRNIQEALRKMGIGMANSWFQGYVEDGTLQAPDIDEFRVKIWTYDNTVKLLKQVCGFKKRIVDMNEINTILVDIKSNNAES